MKQLFSYSRSVYVIVFAATIILGGFIFSAPSANAAIINVSSTIAASTTWTSNNTYLIKNSTITSGVTIVVASGTVVKFNSASSSLTVDGSLQVNGTGGNPIYFTSSNDNSVGTTTPSSTGNPAPGDWQYIWIGGNANATATFNNAIIRYGGNASGQSTEIYVGTPMSGATILNSQIASSSAAGIKVAGGTASVMSSTLSNNGTYGSAITYGSLSITSSTFSYNASGAGLVAYNGSNALSFIPSGNSAMGVTNLGFLTSGTMVVSSTWYQDIPYIIASTLSVGNPVILTVSSGTVVKFSSSTAELTASYGLNVQGTATNPVYFTSIKDDVDGDTNGDGSSTIPAPGDWGYIYSGGSVNASATFNNAIIRYGGSSFDLSNLVANSNMTITNSLIASSSNHGVDMLGGALTITSSTLSNNGYYGIYANNVGGTLSVTSSTFSYNADGAAFIDYGTLNFIPSNNNATGTINLGYVISGSMSASTNWYKDNLPYIISGLSTAGGTMLTINHGTVVKFRDYLSYLQIGGNININGTSTDPVYFTSINDNSIGGNTTGSTTSTPNPGDWGYFSLIGTGIANINNAIIRYGGGSSPYADLYSNGESVALANSQIEFASSSRYGIDIVAGTTTITSSEINNNGYGIYVAGGSVTITSSSFHDNALYGLYNNLTTTSSASAIDNYWNSASGPYNTSSNPSGAGDKVSGHVNFTPWLLNSPNSPKESMHFDGGSALSYSASHDEFAATDPFTIEFWYRTNTTSSVQDIIDARQSNGVNNKGYSISWDWNNGIQFFMGCSTGTIFFNGASTTANSIGTSYDTNGIWHQVTIAKGSGTSSSSFNFYFDGISSTPDWNMGAQGPISGNCFVSTSTASIFFGKDAISTSSPNYLTGDMEEVRIWNTQRSDSDIVNNWNAEAASINGLRGLWQFNGTSTDLVTGNVVSNIGSPSFSTSTPLGGDFLLDQSNSLYKTSAHNNGMLWYPNGSIYSSEINVAGSLWNNLGGAVISSTTNASSADIIIQDINDSGYSWAGEWFNATSSPPSYLDLNTFQLNFKSTQLQEDVMMHELGHALGLDHSFYGNVMNWLVTTGSYPGSQDVIDYNYLKNEGIWGN